MKWDLFYDGTEKKPYESFDDWYKDVKHLFWHSVAMVIILLALLIYVL